MPDNPWRDPAFLRLWVGTTASGLATWALPFVLGLGLLTGDLTAGFLGVVLAARTVGFLIAVPVAGILADRYSRRGVVAVAGLTAAVAAPVMTIGLAVHPSLVLAAAAVTGIGQGACRPAFQALVAEVVPEKARQPANAAITLAVRVTVLAAPALTVLASRWWEVPGLILATGVLWFLAAVVPPRGARTRPAVPAHRPGIVADFVAGLAEARRHPWFLAGLGALAMVTTTGYSVTAIGLPMVSRDTFGGEALLTAATTAYTLGAVAGAVLLSRWRPRRAGRAALTGLACYALAPLSLATSPWEWPVVTAYLVAGLGIELFNVPWFTATQREVAPDKLARVSSLDFLLSYGLAPVGLALLAPAMAAWGLVPVLIGCAVCCLAGPLLASLAPGARHLATPRTAATPADRVP
ncbi:putative MFS family arabinose efflux permease [Stackebrandtia albiflava]|uniref:Putative MFS family arabinose efflux permease n=1 Tax=Stackebrandtia albiflava TaxID=406432 RepID=A0A562UQ74_9ACTN|nr:MFS transporter [Stackebrandtia albiflava]TWJ07760.1 putative MFS family arabinose efflux permease [Stackebrandtia albiflava]